jgi:UDP-GlcNAc:undecaprenyl-phosphate GlcNAc-1-phosphate transferase
MHVILLLALCTFLLALFYTPLCRDLFRGWGLLDRPDAARKIHAEPIPRVGGVALVLSLITTYGLTFLFDGRLNPAVNDPNVLLAWRIVPGAVVVFATGLLDDLVSLRAWQKLVGQLLGAGWAYGAGLHVAGVAGYSAQHWLSVPLTLLWLVLCTNAFNLIDGVDGLATGAGLFATLTMVVGALIQGNVPLLVIALPVAGFLLAFLRYNFNPATVFLGDSGSLLLGFLLGCFGVIWSLKSATLLGMVAPLMAMFVPILDVGLSVIRRFLRNQPIFNADRGHIHHRLLDQGLTPRRAVLLLYAAFALGAVFSILQTVAAKQLGGLIVLVFCAAAWIGVQHLGYVEFSVAGRMLLAGSFQRMLESQLYLRKFEEELAATKRLEECWRVLTEACRNFGFAGFVMEFRGRILRKTFFEQDPETCWMVRIPLAGRGYLSLTRPFDSSEQTAVVPFVQMLRNRLPEKLESLALELREQALAHTAN